MKKKCQVVMLPTERASDILKCIKNYQSPVGVKIGDLLYQRVIDLNTEFFEAQHLYILSDEKIKEGDWYHTNEKSWSIDQCILNNLGILGKNQLSPNPISRELCKKIIATTDDSLFYHQKETISTPEKVIFLPRPSNEFQLAYCKAGGIDEVLVEFEEDRHFGNGTPPGWTELKLKVAPDNTISIYPIKESWNKEKVKQLLVKGIVEIGSSVGLGDNLSEKAKHWIKQNI